MADASALAEWLQLNLGHVPAAPEELEIRKSNCWH